MLHLNVRIMEESVNIPLEVSFSFHGGVQQARREHVVRLTLSETVSFSGLLPRATFLMQ